MPLASTLEMSRGRVVLGHAEVLRDIDFTLHAGEFVVLLGANGSGKTTLIRALLGLVRLAGGSVRLFGERLSRFGSWERIGYVPQRFTAAAGVPATVEEVVLSSRVGRSGWLKSYGREDEQAAHAALEVVGLADQSNRSVGRLSGGQQQRVLIARALAGEPDVLVLDEPVAGVDMEHQQAFTSTLERLYQGGRSVLLVAHALGAIEPLVERAVVLDGGRVTYDGPPLPDQVHAAHVHHHPSMRGVGGRPA